MISDFKSIITQGDSTDFSGINDIEPLLTLTEKNGLLKLEELILFKRFVETSKRIKNFLKKHKDEYPKLEEQFISIEDIAKMKLDIPGEEYDLCSEK